MEKPKGELRCSFGRVDEAALSQQKRGCEGNGNGGEVSVRVCECARIGVKKCELVSGASRAFVF